MRWKAEDSWWKCCVSRSRRRTRRPGWTATGAFRTLSCCARSNRRHPRQTRRTHPDRGGPHEFDPRPAAQARQDTTHSPAAMWQTLAGGAVTIEGGLWARARRHPRRRPCRTASACSNRPATSRTCASPRPLHGPVPRPGVHGLGRLQVARGGRLSSTRASPSAELASAWSTRPSTWSRRRRAGRLPGLVLHRSSSRASAGSTSPRATSSTAPGTSSRPRSRGSAATGDDAPARTSPDASSTIIDRLRAGQAPRHARPPRDRDGARRAVPRDRRSPLPGSGAVLRRQARPRPARRRAALRRLAPTTRTGCRCANRPRSRATPSARCT